MKQLLIIRKWHTAEGTFGNAFAGDMTWETAELPWVDEDVDGKRDPNVSCIRRGVYRARKVLSPKRGYHVYQLDNVPNAEAVQIHKGNFAGDRTDGWDSHVQGCILLGKSFGELRNSTGNMQKAVLDSGIAIGEFMDWANGEEIEVVVNEQFPGVGEITPAKGT